MKLALNLSKYDTYSFSRLVYRILKRAQLSFVTIKLPQVLFALVYFFSTFVALLIPRNRNIVHRKNRLIPAEEHIVFVYNAIIYGLLNLYNAIKQKSLLYTARVKSILVSRRSRFIVNVVLHKYNVRRNVRPLNACTRSNKPE